MSSPSLEHLRMKELLEHQERVLDLVQVGSWEWDPIQDRTYWSKGLYRIFAVEPATHEATLRGYLERVHPEDREWVASLVSEAVESKARLEHESRIVRPDGTVRVLEAKGDPVVDPEDGQLRRYVGTVRDVTRRREREAKLRRAERLASVGVLASGIAHQFNNLLMAVQGHLSFLQADLPEPERYQEDLEGIAHAVDRAAALVDQLLAFSGRQIQPAEPVELNSSLRGLEPMVREIVDDGTDLVLDLAPGVGEVTITADQLEKVILTLAQTARAAMPEGGTVTIRTQVVPRLPDRPTASWAASAPSHYVLLTMEDTGPGIDEEHLKHLFDPFFSTDGWNEELDAGLASVYGIVRGSGGHVDVDSTPDDGCRFLLYLPGLGDSKAPAAGNRSADAEQTIVEDPENDNANGPPGS